MQEDNLTQSGTNHITMKQNCNPQWLELLDNTKKHRNMHKQNKRRYEI